MKEGKKERRKKKKQEKGKKKRILDCGAKTQVFDGKKRFPSGKKNASLSPLARARCLLLLSPRQPPAEVKAFVLALRLPFSDRSEPEKGVEK